MQKKILVLAVAGALAAPVAAMAQVQVYGRANLGIDTYEATGATAGSTADLKKRTRVFDFGSRLGFKGSEDLGGGLSAIFQIESGVNIDTGSANGQSGKANGSTGTLASRDSFVGLKGNAGAITFGRQSIWWANYAINNFAASLVNSELPWTVGASLGRVGVNVARMSNVAKYTSPRMSGFEVILARAFNSEEAQGNTNTDAYINEFQLRYDGGPISVQFNWVANDGATPTAATGIRQKRTGTKLGIAYRYMPGARIGFITTSQQQEGVATANFSAAADKTKQSAWTLMWEQSFGNIKPIVAVGKVGDASGCSVINATDGSNGCDNTGADGQMVGVVFFLSKRTHAYVNYLSVKNKDNGNNDYNGGSYTSANPFPVGADPKVFAAGLLHNF